MSRSYQNDLTGQTFGLWTVIGAAQPDKIGRAKWLCRCSCGKERVVTADNLLRGVSTSCGHTRFAKRRNDLTGQRFAHLTVMHLVSMSQPIWHCRCDCGREVDVAARNLKYGHTTSCGCAQRAAQLDTDNRIGSIKISPLTGPFETNIRAKWFRVSDGSHTWEFKNLSKFVRDNADMFGCDPANKSQWERVAKGLYAAARAHCQWYGWTVERLDKDGKEGTP